METTDGVAPVRFVFFTVWQMTDAELRLDLSELCLCGQLGIELT
jgi:hypothetical protein